MRSHDAEGGKGMMDYRDLMERIEDALEQGHMSKADVLTQLAIADRLDRLCEIMSSRRERW